MKRNKYIKSSWVLGVFVIGIFSGCTTSQTVSVRESKSALGDESVNESTVKNANGYLLDHYRSQLKKASHSDTLKEFYLNKIKELESKSAH
jgi:hypothetical protein